MACDRFYITSTHQRGQIYLTISCTKGDRFILRSHPVMDSTSPVHRGWQLWGNFFSDMWFHGGFWPSSKENVDVLLNNKQILEEKIERMESVLTNQPTNQPTNQRGQIYLTIDKLR
jgi:hypothetical protein